MSLICCLRKVHTIENSFLVLGSLCRKSTIEISEGKVWVLTLPCKHGTHSMEAPKAKNIEVTIYLKRRWQN